MIDQPLITKYRPQSFDEMKGHEDVLRALRRVMKAKSRPHSYLFTGPSGLGKTTSARIIADMLEAEVIEIDAASNSGVDNMRQLVEIGNHMSMTGAGRRMFIIDECHSISKNAWQALLKLIEEPPAHLFIALCTTELQKVPATIIQRCYHVMLRPLRTAEISTLLEEVARDEKWEVANDVFTAVVQASSGSPRKAISLLQAVHDADDREEVKRIIALQDMSDPIIEVAKHLLSGKQSWQVIQELLNKIDDNDLDEAVAGLCGYIRVAMKKASSEKMAQRAWKLLDALTFPMNSYDQKVQVYVAIGRALWSE